MNAFINLGTFLPREILFLTYLSPSRLQPLYFLLLARSNFGQTLLLILSRAPFALYFQPFGTGFISSDISCDLMPIPRLPFLIGIPWNMNLSFISAGKTRRSKRATWFSFHREFQVIHELVLPAYQRLFAFFHAYRTGVYMKPAVW